MSFSVLSNLSMECPPERNYFMVSNPKVIDRGSIPIALQTENLPPTKSQNPNTFSDAMPNSFVSGRAVDAAMKCLEAIISSSFIFCFAYSLITHCLQLFALRIVSAVVNVFELTKKRVYSTFSPK